MMSGRRRFTRCGLVTVSVLMPVRCLYCKSGVDSTKTPETRRDVFELLARQFRVDWQRQCFARRRFRFREVAQPVPQARKAFLQMQRHRIINLRADAGRLEMGLELVALRRADDVLVVDVEMPVAAAFPHGGRASEVLIIECGILLTAARPSIEMR